MFWKKEVKNIDKELDLAKSISPSLNKLTAKIDKINAMVDFLMESKRVDTEKFTRINESMGDGNGLMPDIHQFKDNLEHVMVNNDIQLTPGKSMHCADDILSGVLEETLLSKYFFSDDNIKNIQKLIRYEFYKEKSHFNLNL